MPWLGAHSSVRVRGHRRYNQYLSHISWATFLRKANFVLMESTPARTVCIACPHDRARPHDFLMGSMCDPRWLGHLLIAQFLDSNKSLSFNRIITPIRMGTDHHELLNSYGLQSYSNARTR